MKKFINKIIVVEGKSDVSFLSQYIDAEFVTTNGSEVSKETIDYLRNTKKEIIVLTDPDFPGKKIRDVLDSLIPNLKHCFINKESSIKHGKVGVAEGNIEEIMIALENNFEINRKIGNLSMTDLYNLNLIGKKSSKEKRSKISTSLHLGYCNAKTFLIRLNSKGIQFSDLKKLC